MTPEKPSINLSHLKNKEGVKDGKIF